jgi:DNA-binding phage protein
MYIQVCDTSTSTTEVNVLTLEQITKALEDRRLRVVARETGLHYQTLYRIVNEQTKDPALSTVRTLTEYLTRKPGG